MWEAKNQSFDRDGATQLPQLFWLEEAEALVTGQRLFARDRPTQAT